MVKIILLSGEQNHRCCYCSNGMTYHNFNLRGPIPRNAMTRDHVIPKSYGGTGYYQNIVIACRQCNEIRGNLHAHVFHRLMEEWKKRDVDFIPSWYYFSKQHLWRYKMEVLLYQNLHLKSHRKRSHEDSSRYNRFMVHHGSQLTVGRNSATMRHTLPAS